MPSFMKLLFGGYGSGNWEYLAQHGGTQFLKRKPAQRPFWLPLLYIAMMGIGFWSRGMGLPSTAPGSMVNCGLPAWPPVFCSSPETSTDCPSSGNITSSFSSPL